jgi:hypothetical protein
MLGRVHALFSQFAGFVLDFLALAGAWFLVRADGYRFNHDRWFDGLGRCEGIGGNRESALHFDLRFQSRGRRHPSVPLHVPLGRVCGVKVILTHWLTSC